MNETQGNL